MQPGFQADEVTEFPINSIIAPGDGRQFLPVRRTNFHTIRVWNRTKRECYDGDHEV
jgi:hypothetical protein